MLPENQTQMPDPANPYRCVVAPVPAGHKRPLWSVMIPTYNCAHYLKETLESVLVQDLGKEHMEIWVVDDHSTKDDPEAVVNAVGKGRVKFYRHPQNVGQINNFAACLNLSRGHLVHQLHGDDKVKPGFYRKMQALFEATPELGAAFCRHYFIDEKSEKLSCSDLQQEQSGVLHNWLQRMAEFQIVQTPSMVVKRSVYEQLGGFDKRLKYCEDWEMWVRIAANHPVGYEPEPLAEYRVHTSSNTSRNSATGTNVRDQYDCINIMYQYLDKEKRDAIRNQALQNYAWHTLHVAGFLVFTHKNKAAAKKQIHAALQFSKNPKFLFAVARLYRHVI